ADKLVEGEKVTAEQTEPGKKPATEEATIAKAQEEPQPGKTSIDESGKKAVDPTDEKQGTGVKVTNKDDDTKISAKDEDDNKVPVEINETTGEIEVTPGTKVDGPITVTVEDPDLDGGKKDITIDVNGHKAGQDDNNNGTPDPDATAVDDSNVKPVNPTNDPQDTGIVVTNPGTDTTVSATDEDGKNIPAEIDENGNVIVTPGTNVDGPITVTIKDSDLPNNGEAVIEVPVKGHEKGRDDNKKDTGHRGGSSGGGSVIPSKPDPKPEKPSEGDLNKDDHYQYLVGYPDGTFAPNRGMTRAEVATMFTRLLKDRPVKGKAYKVALSDVHAGDWYADTVGYAVEKGIVSGYPDGSFKPNQAITRAEFASIASRFAELTESKDLSFSDLDASHWGYKAIRLAASNGWISGYPDNTFRPEQAITRAEVTSITNRMLN
ncbi:MAG: S-layer homology domain-containing protein, partial [Peptococcus niger]|nr:S-layer homology domain-containing protein [Peptococcus niger]